MKYETNFKINSIWLANEMCDCAKRNYFKAGIRVFVGAFKSKIVLIFTTGN